MCTDYALARTCSRYLLIILANGIMLPCLSQSGGKQTTIVKTWMLENPQISLSAPPPASHTQGELKLLRKKIATNDENTLARIKYWDAGSPSYRWNQIAPALLSFRNFDVFARTPSAWMNIAIYDATVLALREKNKHQRKRPGQLDGSLKTVIKAPATFSYPCEHSVTAAAAATVLAYFFPQKADSLLRLAREASQSRIDAGVQFPSDAEAGWKLGEQVALQIIEKAKKDGSDAKWNGSMRNEPKIWKGEYPVGITVPSFSPMVIRKADQFRPGPPPDFEAEMQELKNFKQDFYSAHSAYHWASLNGFEFWTDLASQKMFEYRIADDALAASKIYTTLHVALHDAAIVIMDAKYTYWGIRPIQYDSTFSPLVLTPPFPGYPSGHATASATASTVLEHFFPADVTLFQRHADECAKSRFYAGIHFTSDNTTGLMMGKKLGNYIIENCAQK